MKNFLKLIGILGALSFGSAHAQGIPPAAGQWCSSNGTPTGPWSPCAAPAGGSPSNPAYSVQPQIAYDTPHQVVFNGSNAATPQLLVPAGAYAHTVTICSLPPPSIVGGPGTYQTLFFLSLDGTADATLNSGLYVPENGGCVSMVAPQGAIYVIFNYSNSPFFQYYLTYQGG